MIDKIIRPKEVCKLVGACNVHLRRLEAAGKFPPRFKLFEDSGPYGAVGWLESTIQKYLEDRAATAQMPTVG